MEKERQHFYRQMLAIAIPVSLQNLLTSFLNTLDTIMISSLGDASIAGVGLANQVFFLFTLICFGIHTGSAVLFSQYWGVRDTKKVQAVNQMSLLLSTAVSVVFMLLGILFPQEILRLFTQDPLVVQAGGDYLRVAALSYVFTAWSFAMTNALRTTGNPKVPLVATICSFITNAFFNYVFIFGKFGAPALGVVGAAVATLIARIVEVGVLFGVVSFYSGPIHLPIGRYWSKISRGFWMSFWVTTFPVIVNETFWALGQVFYSAAYAMVGTQATAAVQVAVAVQNLSFILVRGVGSSCSIMLGNRVGRNELEQAQLEAKRFLMISLVIGVIIGAIQSLTPQWTLLMFADLSPEVFELGKQLLQIMGIIFVFKTLNSIIFVGILRGGGDTQYGMKLEMACVWLVGVPLALLAAAIWHFPIQLVVICAGAEGLCKAVIGLKRVFSGKWIHRLVEAS